MGHQDEFTERSGDEPKNKVGGIDELITRKHAELPEPGSSGWDDQNIDQLMAEIQGNILKSHSRDHVRVVFFRFHVADNLSDRKAVLGEIARKYVVSAKEQHLAIVERRKTEKDGGTFGQMAFTEDGYGVLSLNPQHTFVDDSAKAFLEGMTRSRLFPGSFDDPAPETFDPFFKEQGEGRRVHGMVLLADDNEESVKLAAEDVEGRLSPMAAVHIETGETLPGEKEHFGYKDGVSQPRFFATDKEKEPPTREHYDGRASLSLVLARDPYNESPAGYGSYLVYRKLEQDVAGFNKWVEDTAKETMEMDPNLFGAFVVGRFKDGTAVLEHDAPNNTSENDFTFDRSSDDWAKCPLHSHIRKANPREATKVAGIPIDSKESVHRRRIARRGIPYGKPPAPDAPAPTRGVGLQFICFQSDIKEQFEVIQRRWIDFELFPQLGAGDDALIGQASNVRQDWPSAWGSTQEKRQFQPPQFVTLKGGDYFFAPSVSFLKSLG